MMGGITASRSKYRVFLYSGTSLYWISRCI